MIGNKPFAMRLDVIIGTTILLGFTAFAQDGRQFEPMEYDARARVSSAIPGGSALSGWPVERASAGG